MQVSPWLVVLLLMAGCSGPAQPPFVAEPVGSIEGIVVDALLRPIPGASVTVGETSVDVASDGGYRLTNNWTLGDHIIVYQAPGYVSASRAFTAATAHQQVSFNVTLAPTPVGRLDTLTFNGYACGIIVQAGHSHGNGDPEDDNHVACGAAGQQVPEFTLGPDAVNDLLLDLRWDANTMFAERLTMVLRDDAGDVVAFDEGVSPLRIHFGQGQITDLFADGRTATIQILAGIPEEAPADVFVGVHLDQPFQLFATLGKGMEVPLDFDVGAT